MGVSKAIYWILYGIAIISCLAVISALLSKLTGHSPTTLDMVLTLQGANLAILIGLGYKFSEFKGRVEEWMAGHKREFWALATDFKASQIEFKEMQFGIKQLQSDVSGIKRILSKKRAA